MTKRGYVLRINGHWVVDSKGRIIKFTGPGANRRGRKSGEPYTVHAMGK